MLIRLLARAQHPDGHWCERDEVVDWPDAIKPPHRLAQQSADKIDYDPTNGLDANHTSGKVESVPLFEVIEDKPHDRN